MCLLSEWVMCNMGSLMIPFLALSIPRAEKFWLCPEYVVALEERGNTEVHGLTRVPS